MQILSTVQEIQVLCQKAHKDGLSIGLVPTMGALHLGHASLIKAACEENDFVVVSVFVNPTQFAPTEDLSTYPRTLENDCALAESLGAKAVFAPTIDQMYPTGEQTWVEVTGHMTSILCGQSRPTHFRGVTTVVTKLFNIISPDKAYFGQKDAQQAQIIRQMADDLFMPVKIRIMPIIREKDGLALSSRNVYLSPQERIAALVLSQSLNKAKELVQEGEKNKKIILNTIEQMIDKEPLAKIDYIELYQFPSLKEVDETINTSIFIALAVKFGKTRLIDNIVIE